MTYAPGDTGRSPDGDNYVVYQDGLRVGGDRNWRNNNPGNIEYGPFAVNHGAIGTDGRFAIFPDSETGAEALRSLMEESYGEQTIRTMMEAYAPPSENNTEQYIEFIENRTGLSADDVVGDLSDEDLNNLADAINAMEGGHSGDTYDRGATDNPDWADEVIDSTSDDGGEGEGEGGGDGGDDGGDGGGDDGGDGGGDDGGDGGGDGGGDDGGDGGGDDGGNAGGNGEGENKRVAGASRGSRTNRPKARKKRARAPSTPRGRR